MNTFSCAVVTDRWHQPTTKVLTSMYAIPKLGLLIKFNNTNYEYARSNSVRELWTSHLL